MENWKCTILNKRTKSCRVLFVINLFYSLLTSLPSRLWFPEACFIQERAREALPSPLLSSQIRSLPPALLPHDLPALLHMVSACSSACRPSTSLSPEQIQPEPAHPVLVPKKHTHKHTRALKPSVKGTERATRLQ